MPRSRLLLIATVVLASGLGVRAQQPEITVDSSPTPEDIHAWLSNGDARLVAWGAYFAGQNGGSDASAQMLRLLDSWKTPGEGKVAAGSMDNGAMEEVLDALIRQNVDVAPRQLATIAECFPVQAAILASRLPIAEATPLLLTWYGDGTGSNSSRLDRVAAMMLSKAPPPGFAAGVVAAANEQLSVSVVDGGGVGSGFGGSCGCGWGILERTGWPPIFVYRMNENKAQSTDPVLIEAGGDRITYHRAGEHDGGGSCSGGVGPLDDAARHALLAEMVGLDKKTMPWQERESASIQWTDGESFLRDLQNQVGEEEAKLRDTVEVLFEKGLLKVNEVGTLRPKLLVTVSDDRAHKDVALPQWDAKDPLTVITYHLREPSNPD